MQHFKYYFICEIFFLKKKDISEALTWRKRKIVTLGLKNGHIFESILRKVLKTIAKDFVT